MYKKNVPAGLSILLIAAFVLAACSGPATPVAPTLDAEAIYTQAAATVAANLAATQAAQPTATNTVVPTATNTLAPTATQAATSTTPQATAAQPGALTPVPTATKAAPPPQPATGDKAEYLDQSPKDGTTITKNSEFAMKFVVKNTGTTTWTPKYNLRFYAGERLNSPTDLNMPRDVKPGETVELAFNLKAPDKTGKTNTVWVLSNADGRNFYSIYLNIEIVN